MSDRHCLHVYGVRILQCSCPRTEDDELLQYGVIIHEATLPMTRQAGSEFRAAEGLQVFKSSSPAM